MPRRNAEVFYVVTRDGRRTSPINFWTIDRAHKEADRLRSTLKKWNDPDISRVEVIKTSDPNSIY
mgnify:CR=1 FL=1